MSTENMVRIRYAQGETGWAEKLKNGKFRIANVPLADGLNIDDVVSCTNGDGLPVVEKIVKRPLPKKVAVYYDEPAQYKKIVGKLHSLGCKCEGLVGPGNGRGIICVAAPKGVNPKAVAEKLGISQDTK